ncbi:MAG: Gfo/Idh/MocA family oxidoreductase [Lentisphaerae bacterium]|jgi:predicted dehydrogenase|nr:Gfo/Idh/MocA family oxidoreductase [Lentisphaerota bacterium]
MGLVTLSELRKIDGSQYKIEPRSGKVCGEGEFTIAATAMEHGHIDGMVASLVQAGATLKWVYDRDMAKCERMAARYPGAKIARCLEELLEDDDVKMVAAADVPCNRAELGFRSMEAGKHYFTDKCPFTDLDQLARAREMVSKTGLKYMVYYSERLSSECSMLADELIRQGAIGKVIQVIGLGPHRMGKPSSRPDWFFKKAQYGGILCDIGSHQCEQFLQYAGARDASVDFARVSNVGHPEFPELEDFGEAMMTGDNGASFYFRVDWFTPDGLRSWGDGRTMIMGTEGTIELRKNIDIAQDFGGNQLYLFDKQQEVRLDARGTIGHPFFGQLIRDCLSGTSEAMTQEHAFKAAELCLKAQLKADQLNK